jgi:hypothetical protein
LQFGGLREDDVPLLGNVVISTTTGALSFVGGQPVQQGNCLLFRWFDAMIFI